MNNYGLCYFRVEGKPLHPDDLDPDISDMLYIKQYNAYYNAFPEDTPKSCVRDDII